MTKGRSDDPTRSDDTRDTAMKRAHLYVRTQVVGDAKQMAAIEAAMQALKDVVEAAGGDLSKGSLTIEEPPDDDAATEPPTLPGGGATPKTAAAAAKGWPAHGAQLPAPVGPHPSHPIAEPDFGRPPHVEPR